MRAGADHESDQLRDCIEAFRECADVGFALVDGAKALQRPRRVAELVALASDKRKFSQKYSGAPIDFRETSDGINFVADRPTGEIAAEVRPNCVIGDADDALASSVDGVHASTKMAISSTMLLTKNAVSIGFIVHMASSIFLCPSRTR